MSGDLERIAEEAVQAFNARDVEAIVALAHPAIQIELFGGFAELMGDRFEGLDGVRRYYTDWFSTFETMHVEVEETLPAGDRLVLLTLLTATVAGTNQVVKLPGAIVVAVRDGGIHRAGFYYERSEALKAVGLSG